MTTFRRVAFWLLCAVLHASLASADPVTWRASGLIDLVTRGPIYLSMIEVGTPWSLEWTFNTSGIPNTAFSGCGGNTGRYQGAVTSASFKLGDFSYRNTTGNVWTNAFLPTIGCGPSEFVPGDQLAPGLVQFEWAWAPWTGGEGGPPLTNMLMLFSYFDAAVPNGTTVPLFPTMNTALAPNSLVGLTVFNGNGFLGAPITLTAVPEPVSLLLVGSGLAGILLRRRHRS